MKELISPKKLKEDIEKAFSKDSISTMKKEVETIIKAGSCDTCHPHKVHKHKTEDNKKPTRGVLLRCKHCNHELVEGKCVQTGCPVYKSRKT